MIKAIIFDCFGVLTTDKWKEFVSTLPENLKESASDINHGYDSGLITSEQFTAQIIKLTGRNPSEVEEILNPDFVNSKNVQLLEYIAILKPKYKIGLLSNVASNWIREEFLSTKEQALFDNFTLSYEVGLTKPDPRIYQKVCAGLGIKENEAVFVDDIDLYCAAAEALGMEAVVYKNFDQMKKELEEIL